MKNQGTGVKSRGNAIGGFARAASGGAFRKAVGEQNVKDTEQNESELRTEGNPRNLRPRRRGPARPTTDLAGAPGS